MTLTAPSTPSSGGSSSGGRGADVLGTLSPQPGLAAPKTPASSSMTEWKEGQGHLLLPRDTEGPTGSRERRLPGLPGVRAFGPRTAASPSRFLPPDLFSLFMCAKSLQSYLSL